MHFVWVLDKQNTRSNGSNTWYGVKVKPALRRKSSNEKQTKEKKISTRNQTEITNKDNQ